MKPAENPARPECFLIMPISDPPGYDPGHFGRVLKDIFQPACELAGYRAVRADDVLQTNFIHLDLLQRLLEAPMVLCDISGLNPNVFFELGLRQAFDRPVVLVQETGTPKVFDIAPLRLTEYRRARVYNEVLEDQQKIAEAIKSTEQAAKEDTGVNSLVRILNLTRPAALRESTKPNKEDAANALLLVRAEMASLRAEITTIATSARAQIVTNELLALLRAPAQPSPDPPRSIRLVPGLQEATRAGLTALAAESSTILDLMSVEKDLTNELSVNRDVSDQGPLRAAEAVLEMLRKRMSELGSSATNRAGP